jgi:hypothetical protein
MPTLTQATIGRVVAQENEFADVTAARCRRPREEAQGQAPHIGESWQARSSVGHVRYRRIRTAAIRRCCRRSSSSSRRPGRARGGALTPGAMNISQTGESRPLHEDRLICFLIEDRSSGRSGMCDIGEFKPAARPKDDSPIAARRRRRRRRERVSRARGGALTRCGRSRARRDEHLADGRVAAAHSMTARTHARTLHEDR